MQLVACGKLHKYNPTPPPSDTMNNRVIWIGLEQGTRHPNLSIERFHPRDQQLCQIIEQKVFTWEESYRIGLRDRHGLCFTVLGQVWLPWRHGKTLNQAIRGKANKSLTWLTPKFPALGTRCISCREFWLALCVVCIFCDWPMVLTFVSISRPSYK